MRTGRLVLLLCLAIQTTGCGKGDSQLARSALTDKKDSSAGHKTEICHFSADTGLLHVIGVDNSAVERHFANHGDVPPGAYWLDDDGDGFGDPNGPTDRCPNVGFVANDHDCNDQDSGTNPAATDPCAGGDQNCDGLVDEQCCVQIRLHCDPNSPVLETVCGIGEKFLAPLTAANSSYVTFGAGVTSVTLHHCNNGPLSGQSLTIENHTNLCGLQGGCCGSPRWNEEVCSIEIN